MVPLNLYGEHWVGLAFTRSEEGSVYVTYIDPENQGLPQAVEEDVRLALTGQSVAFTQKFVDRPQQYNSCGPKVIEELISYATGQAVPSEESIVPLHSTLLEKELLMKNQEETTHQ